MATDTQGLRSLHLRRVLEYWRASLADADRMNVEFKRPLPPLPQDDHKPKVSPRKDRPFIPESVAVPQDQIQEGLLSARSTQKLIELAAIQQFLKKPKSLPNTSPYRLPILICAVSAALQPSYSKQNSRYPAHLTPLWIPAFCVLEPEIIEQNEALVPTGTANIQFLGRIQPHPEHRPFIPRQCLEPLEANQFYPTIGTVEEVDAFLGSTVLPPAESGWPQIWNYSVRMLETVTGNFGVTHNSVSHFKYLHLSEILYETEYMKAFETDGGSTQTASFILIDSHLRGPSYHARKLYDFLLEPKKQVQDLKLLEAYAEQGQSEPDPVLDAQSRNAISEARHLGQMTRRFPLSPSQREALHHTLSMDEGEILAVNGPPGTGKTTLIQSVVASVWVEAALAQTTPPLIIAASSNNQAVTNIISSFGEVSDDRSAKPERFCQNAGYSDPPVSGKGLGAELKQPRLPKLLPPSNPSGLDRGDSSAIANTLKPTSITLEDGRETQSEGLIPVASGGPQMKSLMLPANGENQTSPQPNLSSRWLPGVGSFGLYLPSQSLQDKANDHGFQWSAPNGDGFPWFIYKNFKEARMQDSFRKACSMFFQRDFEDVGQCRERIHSELVNCISTMRGGLSAFHLCYETERDIATRYAPEGGMDAFNEHINEELTRLDVDDSKQQEEIQNLESLQREAENEHFNLKTRWLKHIEDQPWFHTVPLVSLFFRAQASAYRKRFFAENRIEASLNAIQPKFFEAVLDRMRREALRSFDDRIDECRRRLDAIAAERQEVFRLLEKIDADRRRLSEVRSTWRKWRETHLTQNELPDQDLDSGMAEALECRLDVTLRHRAFLLATHYWEAMWLLDFEKTQFRDNDHAENKLFTANWQKIRWERYAMLTPCFVTTFFMLPKFIHRSMKFDLLIVDEAGQVTPEIAGASFALSKRALVVGDSRQIMPVWNIPKNVDLGNLAHFDLLPQNEDERKQFLESRSASAGSVLQIAQNCSRYQKKEVDGYPFERGMFLAEHRRCTDEIIDFCNRLAYRGRLIPKRGSHAVVLGEGYPLPSFGFKEVHGKTRGSVSKFNTEEAKAINEWLLTNRTALEDWYPGKTIEQIVAIVTPFKDQSSIIRRALDPQLEKIIVGTIHVLQGAERNIVLFSYVYDSTPTGFLDGTVNLLNVAVSRAKDSFIIFGNRDALEKTTSPNTGLLRQFVFQDQTRSRVPHQIPFRDAE